MSDTQTFYIRMGNCCPATTTAVYVCHAQATPLESEAGWTKELWLGKPFLKQGTLREMHPYMINKYVQQAAKQTNGM